MSCTLVNSPVSSGAYAYRGSVGVLPSPRIDALARTRSNISPGRARVFQTQQAPSPQHTLQLQQGMPPPPAMSAQHAMAVQAKAPQQAVPVQQAMSPQHKPTAPVMPSPQGLPVQQAMTAAHPAPHTMPGAQQHLPAQQTAQPQQAMPAQQVPQPQQTPLQTSRSEATPSAGTVTMPTTPCNGSMTLPPADMMPNKMTLGRVRYPAGTRSLASFAPAPASASRPDSEVNSSRVETSRVHMQAPASSHQTVSITEAARLVERERDFQAWEEATEAAKRAEKERAELELRARELAEAVEQARRVEHEQRREAEQAAAAMRRSAEQQAAALRAKELEQRRVWEEEERQQQQTQRAWEAEQRRAAAEQQWEADQRRAAAERQSVQRQESQTRQRSVSREIQREISEPAEARDGLNRSDSSWSIPLRSQRSYGTINRTGKVKYTLQPSRTGQERAASRQSKERKERQPSRGTSASNSFTASFEERRRQAREVREHRDNQEAQEVREVREAPEVQASVQNSRTMQPSLSRARSAPAPPPGKSRKKATQAATANSNAPADQPQGSFRPVPQLDGPNSSTIWRRRRCLFTKKWPGPRNSLGLHAMSTILREIISQWICAFLYDVPASLAALAHCNRQLRDLILSNEWVMGSKLRRRIKSTLRTQPQPIDGGSPGKRYTLLANIGQHRGNSVSPSKSFVRGCALTTTVGVGHALLCQA